MGNLGYRVGNPEEETKDHAIIDSGCSGSMTGDKNKLLDFKDYKGERNADFHDVIDFLTGCSVNYALLVSPDVIQQWIQQFWNTAKVRMLNEVLHIEVRCWKEDNWCQKLQLKKQTAKQAAQILRLKTKIKILVKKVKPVIAEYSSFIKIKATLSKKKKLKKAHKKKSSSFKQGRKKVSDGSTGLNEVDVLSSNEGYADVKMKVLAEVMTVLSSKLKYAEVNEGTAEVHEGTAQVNKDKGKGIMKERNPKRRSLLFKQLRAAETATMIEELPRKVAAEWRMRRKKKTCVLIDYQAEISRGLELLKGIRAEQQAALRRESKPPTIPQIENR
ncbi:hypothetical protein Tco_1491518 [Tanacetum coccineum]